MNDTVDTPSYKTRLLDFIRIYLSEEGCQAVYEVLSYLYEKFV